MNKNYKSIKMSELANEYLKNTDQVRAVLFCFAVAWDGTKDLISAKKRVHPELNPQA